MAVLHTDPDAPTFVREAINLADARLGATALSTSDDFFAAKERMLDPAPAVFVPGKYDTNGKWMDGWESRRKRGAGHDWCVVRLARPGRIVGADLDTSHFTGNFPPAASIEACRVEVGDPDADTAWTPLLAPVNLRGNSHHYHAIESDAVVTHVRVNLFPDGGLARLRLYGRPVFDPSRREDGRVDLVAAEQGGRVVAANNEHFGLASNLLLPGRGVNMGDGWETRRRREPGNDWCILALAQPGNIEQVEIDTAFFKGNYPDRCSLQAARVIGGSEASLTTQSMFWTTLLPEQKLSADSIHTFESQIVALGAVSHVRFNIFPDGGVSRLRLRGRPM